MHQGEALPAAFEVEIIERQAPLMRNDDIRVAGEEARRLDAADETCLMRVYDVELAHQTDEFAVVMHKSVSVGDVEKAIRSGAAR